MKNYAPVCLSTYSRIDHLKKTIEALQKNTLALDTDVYIFSDAAKKGDEEIVGKVRKYIRTVSGFKNLYVVERDTNSRIANNRGGIHQLLDDYGRMIFLEDDNITSKYFLEFMNNALDYYENNKKILTICGYMLDIDLIQKSTNDVFLQKVFSAWGFATWKDRNILDIGSQSNFICRLKGRSDIVNEIYKYNPPMLKALSNIKRKPTIINPLDYKVSAFQFIEGKYTLYPKYSFVKNIGADGSGVHAKPTDIWDVDLNEAQLKSIKLNEHPKYYADFERIISKRAMSFRRSLEYSLKKRLNYIWVKIHIFLCKKP